MEILSPEARRALLAGILREQADKPKSHPLSLTQQRLWFLEQMGTGAAYNVPLPLRLAGRLNVSALERSLNEILDRHGVLRAAFTHRDGQPTQLIVPSVRLDLPVVDLSNIPASDREAEARRLATEEAEQPFDLAKGPLMRAKLVRLGGEEHLFLVTMHHISSDGWSVGVFNRELAALYEAFTAGQHSPLAQLPIQYVDFAQWQRNRLQGEVLEGLLAYWRRQLAGLPVLQLPTDRLRPALQSFRGAWESRALPRNLSHGLSELSRRENVTLFMLLLAGFQILLQRYTGQNDIALGTPIANRTRKEVEGLIGFFANTLVMRSDSADDPSFREFLARVREMALEAYAHQDLPFEKLVEELQPERDMSRNPLVQVMFAVQNAPMEPLELAGLKLSPIEFPGVGTVPLGVPWRRTRFDLEVHLWEHPEGLRANFIYNTDLFDAPTIQRMLANYERVLEGMVANPNARLSELPLLSEAERRQVLEGWNDTRTEYPSEATVPELFKAQAARTPEAVALQFGGERLSYQELNARANQVAHYLARHGVGPETMVALCVERSLEMVVATLGILKAGGAYVPLDPEYPAQRLAYMLEDTQAPVLLTQAKWRERFAGYAGRVVCLDTDWAQIERESKKNPKVKVGARNLAYVIYTSGSTGQPKGTSIEHRSVLRLVMGADYVSFGPGLRVLVLAPISFDASTFELWGPLLHGGACVLYPERVPSASLLKEMIASHRITDVFLTTALFNAIVDEAPEALYPLKSVLTGGEAHSMSHFRRALVVLPRTELVHVYGPTETTTFATAYRIPRDLSSAVHGIPIGKPISNTTTYVLDSQRQPVPVGVPGELYIGGAGLAREYLHQPELTAEKFVADPFSTEPGARLYRTGDLVRYRPDGNIEFLGRIDTQVKLRGYRIELGEIEARLGSHPAVRQAVALVREDEPGDKRLVAYVVANEGAPAEFIEQLRAHLRASLPKYMVPAAFVALDALPLTPNGKVDRKALPAPERPALQQAAYIAPRSDHQKQIAAIFGEVLDLDQVGLSDNFFDLGGHSLLLLKVHNKLRESFDQDLSMVELFEYPTVEALARRLGEGVSAPRAFVGVHERIGKRKSRFGAYQPIAIVGMAGRYPGARDPEALWRNICASKEFVTAFSDDELRAAGVSEELLSKPNYVKSGVVLEDVEMFDARFFGYTPREAQLLDPQQRVFLECAWEALEGSGYDPSRYSGAIGVFAGVGQHSYLNLLSADPALSEFLSGVEGTIAGDKDFVATRVSYKLGLKGPSLTVQTACSTSLVAVHVAARSLHEFECDIALAGGVSIVLPQGTGYLYQAEGIGSPDGHCRAFDAMAGGTMNGNGASVVVLKRLEDAIADGDTIHAVIKGSAINNDGASKVGFTAPSIQGQAEVIAAAHAEASVDAATIGYVEAHGTGTRLGDPIEVAALTQAFRAGTDRAGYCGIGSIKTNLGHLNTAAGCTGLIKAALAVRNGLLPPSLHYEKPNPEIDFASTPFYVNTALAPWKEELRPRRAGVSSFGIGGTNAHVVLEEAPAVEPSGPSRERKLLVLSARTEVALDASAGLLAAHMEEHREQALADVAYTLQVGRREFDHRAFALCRDAEEARATLTGHGAQRLQRGRVQGKARPVVFMFTGQGSQYPGMGEGLYRDDALYRQVVDECCEVLRRRAGIELKVVLYPAKGQDMDAAERLRDTQYAQPAIFVTEYALARRWMAWGITPEAMIGHSVGEYVAACLAGVMSLEDALTLVAARGRLVSALEGGGMLAVPLAEPEVQPLLGDSLAIAAVNAPQLCVVSGPTPAVGRLERELRDRGLEPVRLHTSHAFHSKMMDPALAEFARCVSQVTLHAPKVPYISDLSGTWVTIGQATDPRYWVDHLRQGVRFSAGIQKLLEDDSRILLEVGPGNTLAGIARQHLPTGAPSGVFSSLRPPRDTTDDETHLLDALGKLWLSGVTVDWKSFSSTERRRRVPLPTYAFDRQKHWVGSQRRRSAAAPVQKKANITDWFYTSAWARSLMTPPSPRDDGRAGPNLVFVDRRGLGERMVRLLAERGETVIEVRAGRQYAALEPGKSYVLHPASPSDYVKLLADLRASGASPRQVIHLWGVEAVPQDSLAAQQSCQELGFYSLLFLTQALSADDAPTRISVVTEGVHAVAGSEPLYPEKALVLGPCRVIPAEFPRMTCRNVDVVMPEGDCSALAATLLSEFGDANRETVVAYRGGERWTEVFHPVRVPAPAGVQASLRRGGTYLITGGLGGIGLAVAGYLARSVQAKLVLIGRSSFPAREEWDRWLAEHEGGDVTSRRIRKLQSLEADGAEVLVQSVDVADEHAMRSAVQQARARFGPIRGVVHAAGLGGGGIIQLKTRAHAAAVMSPKVEGTRVLHRVLPAEELDFIVLCSSLTSVLGGAGRIEYCAANACLDAFPAYNRHCGGPRTLSINWDTWTDVGMAVEAELPDRLAAQRERTLQLGIKVEEGIEAFRRALAAEPALPQVLVSTWDLGARLPERGAQAEASSAPASETAGQPETSGDHQSPRPAHLSRPFAAPRNATDKTLAGIWQDLMGIAGIGIDDDFFELGGHSLLAIQVLGRANAAFGVKVTLQELFSAPTVAGLSARIEALSSRRGPEYGKLAELAENLEQTSEEDIRRIVAESRASGTQV